MGRELGDRLRILAGQNPGQRESRGELLPFEHLVSGAQLFNGESGVVGLLGKRPSRQLGLLFFGEELVVFRLERREVGTGSQKLCLGLLDLRVMAGCGPDQQERQGQTSREVHGPPKTTWGRANCR